MVVSILIRAFQITGSFPSSGAYPNQGLRGAMMSSEGIRWAGVGQISMGRIPGAGCGPGGKKVGTEGPFRSSPWLQGPRHSFEG